MLPDERLTKIARCSCYALDNERIRLSILRLSDGNTKNLRKVLRERLTNTDAHHANLREKKLNFSTVWRFREPWSFEPLNGKRKKMLKKKRKFEIHKKLLGKTLAIEINSYTTEWWASVVAEEWVKHEKTEWNLRKRTKSHAKFIIDHLPSFPVLILLFSASSPP